MSKEKDSSNIDGMNGLERSLKRVGDFVGALFLLIVLSPVFLYIYIFDRDGMRQDLLSTVRSVLEKEESLS